MKFIIGFPIENTSWDPRYRAAAFKWASRSRQAELNEPSMLWDIATSPVGQLVGLHPRNPTELPRNYRGIIFLYVTPRPRLGRIWAGSRNWYSLNQSHVDVCILHVTHLHIFEKTFAHRACPNFYIFGIKLHRWAIFLFLTNLKNIYSLESYETSKFANICFPSQSWVEFQ